MNNQIKKLEKELNELVAQMRQTDYEYDKKIVELSHQEDFELNSKKIKTKLQEIADIFAPIMVEQKEKYLKIQEEMEKLDDKMWKDG